MQSGSFTREWRAALRGLTATAPAQAVRPTTAAGTTQVFRVTLARQLQALPWGAWLALAALVFLAMVLRILPFDVRQWPGGVVLCFAMLVLLVLAIPLYVHFGYLIASQGTSLRIRRLRGGMLCLMIRVKGFQYVYFDPYIKHARMFRSDSSHALLADYAWLELRMADGLIFRFTSLQLPIWAMRAFHPDETVDLVPTLNPPHDLPSWRQSAHQRAIQTYRRQYSRKPDAALLRRLQGRPLLLPEARSAVIGTLIERGYPARELGQLAQQTTPVV